MEKSVFIVWGQHHRRSELLARHLGSTIHYVNCGVSGKLVQAPIRYVVQALKTWHILGRGKPCIVLVQNPPIFGVIVAFLYAWLHNAEYVIDSHTGAFVSPKWRWSLWLHRFLSQSALLTIVHNKSQERIVKPWGCRYCVLGFIPGDYPYGEDYPLKGQFNVAVISTFKSDEPLDVLFDAAERLPGVEFYITGNSKRSSPHLSAKKPQNCHLTGFLSYGQYIGLLRAADAVMDLTTRDHTLLMGGFEAVSVGTPLITSDWPILREYFSEGTVHIPNSAHGICEGVRYARANCDILREEILTLRNRLRQEWDAGFAQLRDLLHRS